MFDEWGPAPIDSHDLYAMGLRPARCNGCKYNQLKYELGDRFLRLDKNEWVNVYVLGEEPVPGQGEPHEYEGQPVRYRVGFKAIGHSDECYQWRPPEGK